MLGHLKSSVDERCGNAVRAPFFHPLSQPNAPGREPIVSVALGEAFGGSVLEPPCLDLFPARAITSASKPSPQLFGWWASAHGRALLLAKEVEPGEGGWPVVCRVDSAGRREAGDLVAFRSHVGCRQIWILAFSKQPSQSNTLLPLRTLVISGCRLQ